MITLVTNAEKRRTPMKRRLTQGSSPDSGSSVLNTFPAVYLHDSQWHSVKNLPCYSGGTVQDLHLFLF